MGRQGLFAFALPDPRFLGFQGRKIVADPPYLLPDVPGGGLAVDGHGCRAAIVAHFIARKKHRNYKYLKLMVGVAGFEPATPASRTQCSTGLSHTPTRRRLIALGLTHRKRPS